MARLLWLFLLIGVFAIHSAALAASRAPENCDDNCLRLRTLQGDRQATTKIIATEMQTEPDPKKQCDWFRIAAENGDAVGEYNYATCLLGERGTENWHRAIFWLKRASKQGLPIARKALREVLSSKQFGGEWPPRPLPPPPEKVSAPSQHR